MNHFDVSILGPAVFDVLDHQQDVLADFLVSWSSKQKELIHSMLERSVSELGPLSKTEGTKRPADVARKSALKRHRGVSAAFRNGALFAYSAPQPHAAPSDFEVSDDDTDCEHVASSAVTFSQAGSVFGMPRGVSCVTPKRLDTGCSDVEKSTSMTEMTSRTGTATTGLSPDEFVRYEGPRGRTHSARAFYLQERFKKTPNLNGSMQKSVSRWSGGLSTRRVLDQIAPGNCLAKGIRSMEFDAICAAVIMINIFVMSVSIDVGARRMDTAESTFVFNLVDLCFCVWFLVELFLRLVISRIQFFLGPDRVVNTLDVILIPLFLAMAILEIATGSDTVQTDISYIRVSRFLRFLKLFRCARALRMVPWVRLLYGNLMFCGRFVLPTLLLVLCLPYVFSLIIINIVSNSRSFVENIEQQDALRRHWGSIGDSMISLFSTSSGGEDWTSVGGPLREVGFLPYALFLLHALIFRLMITNVVMSGYFQSTLEQMHLNTRHKMHLQLEMSDHYVERFEQLFATSAISYDDFVGALKDKRMLAILQQLSVQPADADRLVFHLTGGGDKNVLLSTLVRGAIMLNDTASKMDSLENLVNTDLARRKLVPQSVPNLGNITDAGTMGSMTDKQLLHVMRQNMRAVPNRLRALCDVMPFELKEERTTFLATVLSIWSVIISVDGGCGFVVAPNEVFLSAANRRIDFQVVDRSPKFPKGYMTQRLRNVRTDSDQFLEAMREFTQHSENDRWPEGHEASNLPKDGFTLVDGNSGRRLKCASRIVGLPTPPYQWDNVGTRHAAALAACWAFRSGPCVVMVRSDGGHIHVLHAFDEKHGIVAWKITLRSRTLKSKLIG